MKFVYNPKGAKLSAATEGDQIPTEAWYKKLQTFIHQIEFHNDTVFGCGNVEQVRLKVFPENFGSNWPCRLVGGRRDTAID